MFVFQLSTAVKYRVEENVSPTRLRQCRKEQRKRGKVRIYTGICRTEWGGKTAKVSEKKGTSAKQARTEDKKEAARNKERKRCENLRREKATQRQNHTGYRNRHK